MFRKFVALLLIATMIGSVAVFPAAAETYAPITIDLWNSYTGPDGEVLDEVVERFNEVNDRNITIVLDRDSAMKTKLVTAYATNTAPVLLTMSMLDMANDVAQGNIVPISDIWDKTTLNKDDFNAEVLATGMYHGDLYILPLQINSRYVYWNKDLLAKAGYDPEVGPKTWDEFKEMSLAMTDAEHGIYGGTIPYDNCGALMSMMIDYGGNVMKKDENGEVVSDMYSPESVEALKLWKSMLDNGSSLNLNITDTQTMMRAGTLGFTVTYPSLSVDLGDYINYGVCVLPAGPATQVNDVAVNGFAISKNATEEEKEAAYYFLEYWNNIDSETAHDEFDYIPAVRWVLECGYPPFLNSLRENEKVASAWPLSAFCEYADYVVNVYDEDFTGIGFLVMSVFTPMAEEIAFASIDDVDSILLKYHDLFNTWKEHVTAK